jgi:EAL domain-containing protein (putative c-di-GMP-specific phosphodiesterase class I)
VLGTGRLRTAYQPVVDLDDGRVVGLEALSRFDPPLGTETTFAAARRLGLGADLERLALRRAVPTARHLGPGQYLAVNASPAVAVDFASSAGDLSGQPIDRLVVEITEDVRIDSYPDLIGGFAAFRRQGLRLAVDDVGAGYSSLRHVVELSPDLIKIDRSLVDGVAADRARRVAITGVVLLALDIGATVVAEGIERADDLDALRTLGVTAGQGFLLARPSEDPEDLRRWTTDQRLA